MPSPAERRSVVLVEGASDQRAVEVLARRRGVDLAVAGVSVVAIGGITNLARHLSPLGEAELSRVSVLYDAGEEWHVHRAVSRVGVEPRLFACHADLEDELIRALGVSDVLTVIGAAGDTAAWTSLRRQPYHRDRPVTEVLRRFMGTTSGRKLRYAALLVEALDLTRVPPALDGVLAACR